VSALVNLPNIPKQGYSAVRPTPEPDEKPLFWVSSSKRDLLAMPGPVVRALGMALSVAQYGGKHPAAKPWKGEGPGIFEVVSNFDGDTFRAVYTVRLPQAAYVLHCFQKKSPSGARTARTDVDLISARLRLAHADYEVRYGKADR
jgi:phage-related protein